MGKVVILSTGGTIAMDRTATSEHPVPSLQGQDFQQRLAQHLPDDLAGSRYYEPGDQGFEQEIARRLEQWGKGKAKRP